MAQIFLAFSEKLNFTTRILFTFYIASQILELFGGHLFLLVIFSKKLVRKHNVSKLSHKKGSTTSNFLPHCDKLCFETKMTKVSSKNLLRKNAKNIFIFLPVFYLIMCLMKAPKNFGKIAILKI